MKKNILLTMASILCLIGLEANAHYYHNITLMGPETIVQKQMKAYNTRDIETFASCFTEDVEVYTFPDQLMYKGKGQLKTSYEGFFKNTPHLYCELVERTVNGNRVKDEVLITRLKGTKPMKTTILYEVEDGLISKMYFII